MAQTSIDLQRAVTVALPPQGNCQQDPHLRIVWPSLQISVAEILGICRAIGLQDSSNTPFGRIGLWRHKEVLHARAARGYACGPWVEALHPTHQNFTVNRAQ